MTTHGRARAPHLAALLALLALMAGACSAATPAPGQGGPGPTPAPPTAAASPAPGSPTPEAPDGPAGVALLRPDGRVVLLRGAEQTELARVEPAAPPGAQGCGAHTLRWSPDGHRLALADGVRTLGAAPRGQIAHAPLPGWDAAWSPDGQRLAYLAGEGQDAELLFVAGPDGAGPRQLGAAHWSESGRPAWSPDGRRLIAGPRLEAILGASADVAPPAARGANASWDRSGALLAWLAAEADATSLRLRVMGWDGRAQRELATLTLPRDPAFPEGALWWTDPGWRPPPLVWLPDDSGLLVAVGAAGLSDGGGTYLVRRDGSARLVTPHLLCDLAPDGGRLLALTAEREVVAVRLADGAVAASYGPGLAAAWRPEPQGPAPPAPLAAQSPTLALSDPPQTGEAVREVQRRLNDLGYAAGTVDGVYGPRTEAAVRAFQGRSRLGADGVVGPRTWAALRAPAPCPASGGEDRC